MSSKSDKNYEDVFDEIPEIKFKNSIDLGKFGIPFSKFNSLEREEFIYFGYEKISFSARHPLYQVIFRNEFVDATRNYKNELRLRTLLKFR